ncbi:MAG: extracellular solute-binding protein [Alphaproteobacteria bacterium]|nr:extracellular solute-binding protein [Alphaproteobacteria bacterium]
MRLFALICIMFGLQSCQDEGEKITVYTSLPERDFQEMIVAFNAVHPDIKISFFRTGTTELMSKLDAEFLADNPKADVLLVSDDIVMTLLRDRERLESLNEIDTTHLPENSYDSSKSFFGTTLLGTGLVCHSDFTPPSQSLHALTYPEMKEKVVMPSPVFSGTSAVNLSVFAAHNDFGWDFWKKFLQNNPLLVKGNGSVLDMVAKKGRMCGLIVDVLALNAIKDGAGLKFFYFDEGAPIIREPIGILKGTKNYKNALTFVTFILSKEGQEKLASLGFRPIRRDVPIPKIYEMVGPLNEMPMDARHILNRIERDRIEFSKALH